ncbi:SUMF1/EgtB/PvdO family nonheme iron enzyme [Leptothoe sp. LEGE 181152]|nr:SUMF1/EgtB/PvdO family nonheme iron enzyme [Leptothoe sp. LEGE 181152]
MADGVGEYGSGLKPLRCPANGVNAMQELLENPEIGGFDQVVPLINPDVGTMQARIGEVFGQLSKNDLVLFYFTGHGIKDMSGNFYLSTTQTQLFKSGSLNPGTAVAADFVKRVIRGSYAQRKVVILDCCFASAFAEGITGMDDSSIDVETQLGGKGWCVMTASKSTRYALEQEGEDLSVYTRYLVDGIRTGGAASDEQERIYIKDLHSYVQTQVKAAAPAMEPAIFNGLDGTKIAIAKIQVDSLQRYRKQVQRKVRNGRIRPAALANLKQQQIRLRVSDEDAAAILEEVLKPYREKAKHLETYKQALIAEKEFAYPLDDEAIEELEELKRQLNLRDEDVRATEKEILGDGLKQQLTQPPDVSPAPAPKVKPVKTTKAQKYQTFSFKTARVDEKGKVIETLEKKAEFFAEDLGDGIKLEMVKIPGGTFMMGAAEGEKGASDDEYPRHKVTVSEFWMGKFAVTQEQWQAVAKLKRIERDLNGDPARFKGAKHPVEKVSWQEAEEFCKRLSKKAKKEYKLPSEAQWEYACRANTKTPFHFGPTITKDLVNYYDGKQQGTKEVGSFAIANPFGLYDMHGNVWEWCLDDWHDTYKDAPKDGSAWISLDKIKILRGSSWDLNPVFCRSANRSRSGLVRCNDGIGFRVVCFPPRT